MLQQIMLAYGILARRWRSRNHVLAQQRAMIAVLTFALLITISACQQHNLVQSVPTLVPSPTSKSIQSPHLPASRLSSTLTPPLSSLTPTPIFTPTSTPISASNSVNNAHSRNHVHTSTLFVRVTFTASSNYDQAVAALKAAGEDLYPWNCDDPRTPTPPTAFQQRTLFASSHVLFISYPNLPGLDKLASSPHVLSIDPQTMSMCP